MQRRVFLTGTLAVGAIGTALAAGLLSARRVLAAWPTEVFNATTYDDALRGLVGEATVAASDAVVLEVPAQASDGARVRVMVSTTLTHAESITILAKKNPYPCIVRIELAPGTRPRIETQIKVGATADVVAIVKAGDTFYSASQPVDVPAGACG